MIFGGANSQSLAAALASELDDELALVDYERFPDGELKTNVGDVDPERAIVVGSTVDSDAHVRCLQLQDAVREAGASEVVTVLPYMGYARQDEAFAVGDPVSARAMARAISTGADRVLTVNPHETAVCEFFEPTATAVDAAAVLAEPLPDDLADPLFLAPDEGARGLAGTVRDAYGRGAVDHFVKQRFSGDDVEVTPSDAAVAGRDVVVVDDIVATGTTMSESIAVLGERSAASVSVATVHPLFARNAVTKLERAGVERIVGTDTLERPQSVVSVAPAISNHL
ncbi:ribose-phosphate diphosphokinase [Halorubellus sp. JP-L1]|uniref:ribose-phosphate diphosphokinase n=1 Tax=Halorubellus sp. JP-L1 TaxID=2715753 RepID=UPI00140E3F94|nr:ribose-phosphate diphosphokinase [Halorubellus sp. JP-L1]NHN41775.1 ribose-phosphate diphosphokinase [Halorubellus sp. JP-L1]